MPRSAFSESLMSGGHQFGHLTELVVADNPQLRPVTDQPIGPVPICPGAGKKIRNFLFAVDDFPGIERVGQNSSNCALIPWEAPFGFESLLVQQPRDPARAKTFQRIPVVDPANNGGLAAVNSHGKAVALGLVIAVDQVRDPSPLGVHPFAEFDTLGQVGGFLLGQSAKDGQDKLAVPHGGHVGGKENRLDAQRLQSAHALQQINGVSSQPGDVLDHHQLKKAPFRVGHHLLKLPAAPDLGTGQALVGIKTDQAVAFFFRVFHEKPFLGLQAVQLVGLVGGNAAISGDVHGGDTSPPSQ